MNDKFVDEESWTCFVNSVYHNKTKTWTCCKRPEVDTSTLFKQRSQPGLVPRVGSPLAGRREASGFFVCAVAVPECGSDFSPTPPLFAFTRSGTVDMPSSDALYNALDHRTQRSRAHV